MKRKLDADHAPVTSLEPASKGQNFDFTSYGLDPRLLQAIAKENFATPTPVQAKVIPLALEGRDILARSKTGSGKTAAYLLPILQSLLKRKLDINAETHSSALILVPTRELAEQVLKVVIALTAYCNKEVRAVNLTHKIPDAVQRSLLADSPDIVIATPARASANISNSALLTDRLTCVVIDEADLVMSYGYKNDLQNTARALPKGIQTFLMSATLNTEIDVIKDLFCRNPAVIQFEEKDETGDVSQFVVRCGEDEKFLLVYVIFKLKLIKGKCIIFVGDIDRCYRLKLYLEQFGIKVCILNSELPLNSRIHVVEEFNKNIYDIIIATDEHGTSAAKEPPTKAGGSRRSSLVKNEDGLSQALSGAPAKRKKQGRRDREFGVSRGIDFKDVACVLNFDLPTSPNSYTHRIGRTARAGNSGMALSFVVPSQLYRKHKSISLATTRNDETVLDQIIKDQGEKGKEVTPYQFDMKQVIAFRYRMEDALRAITRLAIREARAREIRQELLKSEKLKRHFEENPADLQHLRHDHDLRVTRVQSHLKHVPDYLLPNTVATSAMACEGGSNGITLENLASAKDGADEDKKNAIRNAKDLIRRSQQQQDISQRPRGGRPHRGASGSRRDSGKGKRKLVDPLKSFTSR